MTTQTVPNIKEVRKSLVDISQAYSIGVKSPVGKVFVHCTEDANGKLDHIIINIGKAGSEIAAWADSLSRMLNMSLQSKSLSQIIDELSNITADKVVRTETGVYITSGPEAVFYALMLYSLHKNKLNPKKKRYGFLPRR